MYKRVLGIFNPREKLTPTLLFSATISAQVASKLLVQPLYLSVGLGVIAGGETHIYPSFLHKAQLIRGKVHSTIRHNILKDAIALEHVLEQGCGRFYSCGEIFQRY